MIYLDSSAIVKLIREESESPALHSFLATEDAPPLFTSQLAITEVKRTLHAAGEPAVAAGVGSAAPPAVLVPGHRILALPITAEIAVTAGDLCPGSALRSLDAIHLATALQAGEELTALVTYDRRMRDAATSLALPVAAPAQLGARG
jgi:uncharacterized protein